MKTWKVILATLAIFSAGMVTGGLLVQQALHVKFAHLFNPPPANLPPWAIMRREFLERMDRDLALSPEQHARIEKIMAESQERTKILWKIIGPEMEEELRLTREKIRFELKPGQQEKFQELLKPRSHRKLERPPPRGTAPNASPPPQRPLPPAP